MIFNGIEKNSLIEWPGKVSAVLFLGGCSFRCPFCYNSGLVLDHTKLPSFSEKKALNFLEKRKKFLDGVMITGGEPLLEVRVGELIEFIKKVKELGLLVGLETNGSNPKALAKLLKEKLLSYVAMDIKAPLTGKDYEKLTGVKIDIKKIKRSIGLIKNSGIDYEFRTTVAPLLSEKDILQMAVSLKGVKKFALQVFRPVDSLINPSLAKMKFFSREELEEIGQKIKDNFKKFEIRG
jgi:pyruvate formate lyase activating enzyme